MDDEIFCETCGQPLTRPADIERGEHYRCAKASIGFRFVGGGGFTREEFRNFTNAEICRRTEANAERIGVKLEKVPVRKELI